MIKHMRFPTIISGVLLLYISAFAQLEYELNAFFQSGYENNIFHSPSTYIDRDGVLFNEDSLIQSDAMNGVGWDLELEREYGKKHRLRLQNSGWFRYYSDYNSANQSDIDIELKYDYEVNRKFELGAEVWGSKSNRIGTNVLGDELTKNFAYNEIGMEGFLEAKLWDKAEGTLEMGWRYRNFRNEPGVESLTYTESAVSIDIKQEFGNKDLEQYLGLQIEYKNKPYRERTANDSFGYSGDPMYPERHWRYLTGVLSYGLQIMKYWELEPFFKLRHRADLFQDYFDYNQIGYGITLGYEKKRFEMELDFSFREKQYLIRKAPQETSPFPDLNYRYFKYGLKLEYNVFKTLVLIGEFNLIQRKTNVSIETMKTRRSYDRSNLSLGLVYGIDGIFR